MMESKPIEEHEGLFASFWHDYTSFGPNVNWRNFTLVHASFEYNPQMGYVEWEFALLGFGYRGTYVFNANTELRRYLDKMIDEIDEARAKGETTITPPRRTAND